MWKDAIVEEIRKEREEHAARFGYDIKAIVQALKEEELRGGRRVVSFIRKSGNTTDPSQTIFIPDVRFRAF